MVHKLMNELWIECASNKFIQDNDNVVISFANSEVSQGMIQSSIFEIVIEII